ncbi:cysteine hydrolase family protein [Actinoplanes sp. RD1]|uniref:cysteine hydrolase family protein n=1 Tax=Actinoplanes sp. RD1 TaxID=3064538 RepID=UPI002741AB9B|nr:isochorismatase family cysteine hydrolase [Actinoplanes sp. RD1]
MSAQRDRQLATLPGRPALIVVDVQRDFAEPERIAGYDPDLGAVAKAVEGTAEAVRAARAAGVPVIWVELGSDPAHPWRASDWFQGIEPAENPCVVGTEGAEWYGVTPEPGETRVVKRGYSGFVGTDLEQRLMVLGTGWLAVCGLTTECCVAATVVDAFQRDYPVLVPRDAVAAYDPAVNAAALTQLELTAAVLTDNAELAGLFQGATA